MGIKEDKKQYLQLMSKIVAKGIVVFGPDAAILKARSIAGLVVDNNGNVTEIEGFAADAFQQLVDEYIKLSDQSLKNVIDSILKK